ncbi:MAG: mycothiol transferase [Acidimicrobiales bacterium]
MTSTLELLVDGFGRVHETVHEVVSGLSLEALVFRPEPRANTIGWLVWHLTRVQDDHVADVAGAEQRWTAEGWDTRFALPFERAETGYGQSPQDVGDVAVEPELLLGYHDSVGAATLDYVRGLGDSDLDRVVDTRWDPHVTLGARLVSVLADDLQHVGQAAYVRGIFERRKG